MDESVQHPNKSIEDGTNRVTKLNGNKARWYYNAVCNTFTEFTERSSIHGIRYLSERTLHWSERLWWLISLVSSVFVCIYFIHQIWLKLTLVVITFNDQATPISEIPFPTITICSDNVFSPSVLNYSHHSDIMHDGLNVSDNVQIDRNILPHLRKVSPDLVKNCRYSDVEYRYLEECKNGFSEVLTDHGLCYTFNHLSSKEIYRAELLADDFLKVERFNVRVRRNQFTRYEIFNSRTYPLRAQRSGEGINLMISLPTRERLYDGRSNMKYTNSVILFIHSGEDVQQLSNRHYIIPLEHRAILTVRPNIISTDDGVLKLYNKYQRKCIAKNENELKFFRRYTQSNCHLEHLINETLNACNCSYFWMPRENDTQICYGPQIECATYVEVVVIPKSNLTKKCLPACETISYDANIYFTNLDHEWWDEDYIFSTYEDRISTEISISFENEQYFGLERSESYGKVDFVTDCGGILGLFLGCSFLSFIELIYFATLRVCCNLRKKRVVKNQLDRFDTEKGPLEMHPIPMALENGIEASNNIEASDNGVEAMESAPNN